MSNEHQKGGHVVGGLATEEALASSAHLLHVQRPGGGTKGAQQWYSPEQLADLVHSLIGDGLPVLDPTAGTRLSEVDAAVGEVDRVTLIVGPEGGVSDRELARFEAAGALRVRLGAEILRTSTAGPAALAVLNARLGRW